MAMQDTHVVTNVTWDQAKQSFVVNISAAAVLVENADLFDVRTKIIINNASGQRVGVLDPKTDGIAAGGPVDNLGMVPLFPVTVAWDRNGGAYSGASNIRAVVTIHTNKEKLVEKGCDVKV